MPNGNGSSRWNGNYGEIEAARRKAYGAIAQAEKDYPKDVSKTRERQGEQALEVSDTVPRDVVKPIEGYNRQPGAKRDKT